MGKANALALGGRPDETCSLACAWFCRGRHRWMLQRPLRRELQRIEGRSWPVVQHRDGFRRHASRHAGPARRPPFGDDSHEPRDLRVAQSPREPAAASAAGPAAFLQVHIDAGPQRLDGARAESFAAAASRAPLGSRRCTCARECDGAPGLRGSCDTRLRRAPAVQGEVRPPHGRAGPHGQAAQPPRRADAPQDLPADTGLRQQQLPRRDLRLEPQPAVGRYQRQRDRERGSRSLFSFRDCVVDARRCGAVGNGWLRP